MKTIFNKALWASAIGACTLSLGSCTDLSETIYDTIASEKYEFTEKLRFSEQKKRILALRTEL